MKRRQFIKLGGLSVAFFAAGCSSSRSALASGGSGDRTASGMDGGHRPVVLIELNGGNDGLNTVIPYGSGHYYDTRPGLAIAEDALLALNDQVGFHPALSPLMALWDNQQLAVVQGVGYSNPNRSHFRSIEIWETGSDSEEYLDEGWIARTLGELHRPDLTADGIVVGNGSVGPLDGHQLKNISMRDPEVFMREARRLSPIEVQTGNPGLDYVIGVQNTLIEAGKDIEAHLNSAEDLDVEFPASPIGRQLEIAANLIAADVPVAVIKVQHGSFDTHANQRGTHRRLLDQLAQGIAAFRDAMVARNRWEDVLLMTYSEFGRRVAENGSGGTDHGTAAPHFVMGGRVQGGLYGEQPSLKDLDEGDLKHTMDYRALYNAVARQWWQAETPFSEYGTVEGVVA